MYSATDSDLLCRRCLLSHPSPSRARHVFGDVLERLPQDTLAKLKRIEQHHMKAYEQAKASCNAAQSGEGRETWNESATLALSELKSRLGEDMLAAMCAELGSCSFSDTVWC